MAAAGGAAGRGLAALRRAGVAENTLVVVTGDNGPWFEGDPGGLRGRKGQSYEGGFRVPFVVWWPGRIPANAVSDTPAMNIDLFPTFLGLAGLSLPSDRVVDGADLWPVLSAGQAELSERPLFFFHDYDVEAVRVGRWKLIDRNSHYVWPAPLDKQDTPAGRLATGRDYRPPGPAESVPTPGTSPLPYDLRRAPPEAYNAAQCHPERGPAPRASHAAHFTSSFLSPGAPVGAGARLHRCIVDKNVAIPESARIGFDPEADAKQFTISDNGIVVIAKGQIID